MWRILSRTKQQRTNLISSNWLKNCSDIAENTKNITLQSKCIKIWKIHNFL